MYIRNLIEALKPFGDVLEVGYGKASKEIQKFHPRSHTLITSDEEAFHWAQSRSIKVIDEIWQTALPSLGVFDTIFFGLVDLILPIQFQYTDSVLIEFCEGVKDPKALSKFLAELEQNSQITTDQKEEMIRRFGLTYEKPSPVKQAGQILPFLTECVENHMKKGSRFSCYLKNELDDSRFFDEIVVNPILDVRENGRIIVIEKMI